MPDWIKKIIQNSFIRYLFVGGINTCFGYLVFAACVYLLKNVYIAVPVATVIGVLFNFNTYGAIVFNSRDYSRIFRFFGIYLLAMGINMGCLRLFAQYGLKNPYIGGAILTLPVAALSFVLMRKFVFNAAGKQNPEPDGAGPGSSVVQEMGETDH